MVVDGAITMPVCGAVCISEIGDFSKVSLEDRNCKIQQYIEALGAKEILT